jgi:HSP20 family molecular chaperone IbpA
MDQFERRISFGYDPDMARVRAEFNTGVLKIVVSRRRTISAPAGYDPKLGLGGQQGNM